MSELASGGRGTPQRNWDNLPDLPRAMPVKVSVKDGKISKMEDIHSGMIAIMINGIYPLCCLCL